MRAARLPSVRVAVAVLLLAVVVAACGGGSGGTVNPGATAVVPDADALPVVATTTVFADLVAQVGGPRVSVTSLVPKGGEVHTFDPTPAAVQRLSEARLIVMNGLGLDDWLTDLVADSGSGAPVLRLAEGLEGVDLIPSGEDEGHGDAGGEDHDETWNPHLWLDVAYAARYVDRIETALTAAAPADAATFAQRAAAYRARLADLDAWARAEIGRIAPADRRVVSFHEAFPYFAAAYGLEIVGTVVSAPGQDPSAGTLADLIREIRATGVRAVFAEAQYSDEIVRTIAEESGTTVVTDLYNDSLGDAPADTYEGMVRWNVERVVGALAAG